MTNYDTKQLSSALPSIKSSERHHLSANDIDIHGAKSNIKL